MEKANTVLVRHERMHRTQARQIGEGRNTSESGKCNYAEDKHASSYKLPSSCRRRERSSECSGPRGIPSEVVQKEARCEYGTRPK